MIQETLPHLGIWVFGIGLVLGSFANVVIYRLPLRKSVVRPPSHCPSCKKRLPWHDNVPVLSFILLRGRCRFCKSVIDVRYPVIELLAAVLLSAVWIKHIDLGWVVLRPMLFAYLLLIITFIDLDHRLIPDRLSLGGLAVGLITAGFDWRLDLESMLVRYGWSFAGAALGFGFFYAMSWLYWVMTRRQGLGGGDVKLLAMIGAFSGPSGVLVTLFVSSIAGSLAGVFWGMATRQKNLRQFAIPYGPFLAIGALVYDLFGEGEWLRNVILN